MKTTRSAVVVSGAVMVLTALSACAGIEIQTDDFGGAAPGSLPPFTSNLSFNLFNPSSGTLNDIVITLSTTATGVINVYNFNYQTSSESIDSAAASSPVTATGPGGDFASVTAASTTGPHVLSVLESTFSGAANTSASEVNVAPGNFSYYEGVGSGTYNVSVASGSISVSGITSSGSDSDFIAFGGSVNVNGSVSIEYDYTPVPEPVNLALGIFAGLGLLVGGSRWLWGQGRQPAI